MRLKAAVQALLPEGLVQIARARYRGVRFRGNYRDWSSARTESRGYDDQIILEKVLSATLAVQRGEAAYERDSVLFKEAEYDYRLLAALSLVAATSNGRLRVLDFGGALGSCYWRHRQWLDQFSEVQWHVVEQQRFVAAGRRHFRNTPLKFFESVEAAQAEGDHDVLLTSTALQYVSSPHTMVESWITHKFSFFIFNNLPVHVEAPDRIAVQEVPSWIYPASYPVWFFNKQNFFAHFQNRYELIAEFPAEATWLVGWKKYSATGFLMRRLDR